MIGIAGETVATSSVCRERLAEGRQRVGVRCVLARHRDDDRAVVTRPESLGDEVVRLAHGLLLVVVAGIAEAEPQPEHRQREHDENCETDEEREPRLVLDDAAPPEPHLPFTRLRLAVRHLFAQLRRERVAPDDHQHEAEQPDEQEDRRTEEQGEQRAAGHRQRRQAAAPLRDLDLAAGEPDEGREQGDRGDHHEQHARGGTGGEAAHEREAHDVEAQQ